MLIFKKAFKMFEIDRQWSKIILNNTLIIKIQIKKSPFVEVFLILILEKKKKKCFFVDNEITTK